MKRILLAIALITSLALGAELNITWTDNSTNEDGFELERSINGTDFVTIELIPPDIESTKQTGLAPETEYWYRIRAFNPAGNSGYSNVASATTSADEVPPNDPGNVNLEIPGRLANISARGPVLVGADVVIGGIVIADGPVTILIRAIGPTLSGFGIPSALADPNLILLDSGGTPIVANDNWSGQGIIDASIAVGAFALPAGSLDSAILINLQPGSYTTHLSGVGGVTGTALLEIFEVK